MNVIAFPRERAVRPERALLDSIPLQQSNGGTVVSEWNGFVCTKEVPAALGRVKIRKEANEICQWWPNLQKTVNRVASLMTHHHPSLYSDGKLLDATLLKAFVAFKKSRDLREVAHDPQAPLRAILMVLLDSCMEMADYAVFGEMSDGKVKLWPSFEEPISSWASRNKVARLIFETRPGQRRLGSVRAKVAAATLSLTDCMILGSEFDRWFVGEAGKGV